jgi:hypothetical protein
MQTHAPEESKIAEEPKISEELEKMPYEPLLPIEKKLVLWSVVTGVVLLTVLMWLSQVLFHT